MGENKWAAAKPRRPISYQSCSVRAFFSAAFSCEYFLDSLRFAGLQVKGVALNLLDYVFLMHLAFKTTQRVSEGLSLLQPNFRQLTTPPNSSRWTG